MKSIKEINIIILCIIVNENLLRLIPGNILSLVSLMGVIVIIFNFKNIVERKYIFKKYIIAINIICFLSSIGSYYMFGQPLNQGIYGMNFIFIYFIYFFFTDLLRNTTESDLYNIKEKIVMFATILSVLYIFQAILYPKLILFNMDYAERGARVRFFNGYVFIMFSIVIAYSMILTKFNKKVFINFLVQIISLVVVSQTRNFILGIAIVLLAGLFISNKLNRIIILYLVLFILTIYLVFFSSSENEINKIISSTINETITRTGTIGTRFNEFIFYWELLKKNIFTGIGILYSRFELTPIITGYYPYYYFIGDLGLIGVIIQTGIIGMIWMVMFFYKIFSFSKKIKNKENSYLLKFTLILIIATFASGLIFDKGSIMYICLILAIGEQTYKLNKYYV